MNTQHNESQAFLEKLNDSYHISQLATKNSSFYMAILLSAKTKQNALFSIYAWLHAVDAIADDTHSSINVRKNKLREFQKMTYKVLADEDFAKSLTSFWLAFRDTIIRYKIPNLYLDEMIAGQENDLQIYHYKTFSELYHYCRQVASMVGLMCIHIWGYRGGKVTEQKAEWCGIAFQLTNILRDISEDKQLNRVYLPAQFFDMAELTANQLEQLPKEKILDGVLKVIEKADHYYQKSLSLYQDVDESGRFSFLIMFNYYHAIFEKIRQNPQLIFSTQIVKLSKLEKFCIVSNSFIKYRILHST